MDNQANGLYLAVLVLICQAIDSTNDGKVNKIRTVEWFKAKLITLR